MYIETINSVEFLINGAVAENCADCSFADDEQVRLLLSGLGEPFSTWPGNGYINIPRLLTESCYFREYCPESLFVNLGPNSVIDAWFQYPNTTYNPAWMINLVLYFEDLSNPGNYAQYYVRFKHTTLLQCRPTTQNIPLFSCTVTPTDQSYNPYPDACIDSASATCQIIAVI